MFRFQINSNHWLTVVGVTVEKKLDVSRRLQLTKQKPIAIVKFKKTAFSTISFVYLNSSSNKQRLWLKTIATVLPLIKTTFITSQAPSDELWVW